MGTMKVMLVIVGGILALYVGAAPYLTVYQMKSAAENHAGAALAEYIEFPSVRQSLKDQMNAAFATQMAKDEKIQDNPFAAIGAAFAGAVVEKMVDAYVTPSGITELMAGEKFSQEKDHGTPDAEKSTRELFSDASMSYESLDKFVVKINNESGYESQFVLRRRGMSWKLTEVMIPLAALAPPAPAPKPALAPAAEAPPDVAPAEPPAAPETPGKEEKP